VGALPASAKTLAASLDAHNPQGKIGTPIEGALRGATEFCKKYQLDHAGEQCVAVLVTDGKPENASGCKENSNDLAAIAGAAHTAGVTTFAVGLQGADFTLLDKIAKQGGAPDCDTNAASWACNVSGGAAGASKLVDALTAIRESVVTTEVKTVIETHVESSALPCEWEIPAAPAGETFDRNKVNIKMTTADAETTFVRVTDPAQCQPNGWTFDDLAAPTRMLACPQACEQIKAVPDAKMEVLLGCETIVLVPQ
jgi:hypothetical protein